MMGGRSANEGVLSSAVCHEGLRGMSSHWWTPPRNGGEGDTLTLLTILLRRLDSRRSQNYKKPENVLKEKKISLDGKKEREMR